MLALLGLSLMPTLVSAGPPAIRLPSTISQFRLASSAATTSSWTPVTSLVRSALRTAALVRCIQAWTSLSVSHAIWATNMTLRHTSAIQYVLLFRSMTGQPIYVLHALQVPFTIQRPKTASHALRTALHVP